ncbi:MAG TPA: tRNA pseudouridine(38-40) synthase TruA [Thermoanaerobaculia bacterium]|nr:tRNA pseudouridine(38-40) synthase TruA [Thermoanaerobaculia bacterium]
MSIPDRALVGTVASYRLTVSYLGAAYGGWQRQANTIGVQEVVETALERLVREPVRLVAAGRTDAGVHAAAQEAHVRLSRAWPSRALVEGSNHYLPPDVRLLRAIPVAPDFHARAWAVAKEYHYRMSRAPVLSPFDAPTTVRIEPRLDLERLGHAAALLEGRHDFRAFARSGGSHRHSFRRVFRADVTECGPGVTFRIVGDGFLRGMVRAVVGSLLWVARGRLSLERWAALLEGAERIGAGPSAPARGLVLVRVFYPDEPSW